MIIVLHILFWIAAAGAVTSTTIALWYVFKEAINS